MRSYQHLQQNAGLQLKLLHLHHSQRLVFPKCSKSHFRDFPPLFLHRLASEAVSNPEISFKVIKEASRNFSAAVTCQSDKGTTPVTFSLYNRTDLVASTTSADRKATFKVPLILGEHMGWLQCQANNGDQTASSKQIPIQVGMNRALQRRTTRL